MRLEAKPLLFWLATALIVVGSLEIGVRLLALASQRIEYLLRSPWEQAEVVPDERLGHRPSPLLPDHDENGFRNPSVPTSVDIVALGDSQTYGTGVRSREAWPAMLGSDGDLEVYSMAFGGYSPVHSLLLLNEALELRPRIIIEAIYSGNDAVESFLFVYEDSAATELKSRNVGVQRAILDAEEMESIRRRAVDLHQGMRRLRGAATRGAVPRRESGTLSVRTILAQNSVIYAALRRARYEWSSPPNGPGDASSSTWERARQFAETTCPYCEVFDDGGVRTILTPEYRLIAVDWEDPRVREGHAVAIRAIARMSNVCVARDVRFFVVGIPTKELVFRERVVEPSELLQLLTDNEARFWEATAESLDALGIEYIDVLPALRSTLATGGQPYKVTEDGHPNATGHRAIAEAVRARLAAARALP